MKFNTTDESTLDDRPDLYTRIILLKKITRCRDSMIPSDYQVPLIMICFSALLPISDPSNVFIKISTPTLIGTLILILFSLAMQS